MDMNRGSQNKPTNSNVVDLQSFKIKKLKAKKSASTGQTPKSPTRSGKSVNQPADSQKGKPIALSSLNSKSKDQQKDSAWNFNERISRIRNSLDRIHLLMSELKSLQNNKSRQPKSKK